MHPYFSLVPRIPDLFDLSACNNVIEKLGIGPGTRLPLLHKGKHLMTLWLYTIDVPEQTLG